MAERLRIGVIGLGIMGEQYVRVYSAHPLVEVAALCTLDETRLTAVGDRYGVARRFVRYEDMLREAPLDAVCVATPDHAHAAPVRAALEAGLHVICEKPFTTDLAEADALLDLCARRPGQQVQVTFNHRWLASYNHGAGAIKRGDIGRPLTGYARKNDTIYVPTDMLSWAASTTPMHFLGAHDIDLMRWFFGREPVSAHAGGVKEVLIGRGIDTYDAIQALVRFDGGGFATFESSWIYPNTFPSIVDSFVEVLGTSGHLHFDRKRESIEMSTPSQFTFPKVFLSVDVFGKLRGAFVECLHDFVDAIRHSTPPHVTAYDGRQVTAVLDAVSRSLISGHTEPVVQRPAQPSAGKEPS